MSDHIVIDGNAFYEVDDDCMRITREKMLREKQEKQPAAKPNSSTEQVKKQRY